MQLQVACYISHMAKCSGYRSPSNMSGNCSVGRFHAIWCTVGCQYHLSLHALAYVHAASS